MRSTLIANAAVFELENSQFSTFASDQNVLQDTLTEIAKTKERMLWEIKEQASYPSCQQQNDADGDDDDGLAGVLVPANTPRGPSGAVAALESPSYPQMIYI